MSLFKISLAAAAFLASATAAHATAITVTPADVGTSYTVDYDGYADGSVIDGLTGQTTFTLTGVTGNSYTFDYNVTNTSGGPIDASRISIFGFNTDPDITDASATGEFNQTATGNVPSGFGTVELCFKGAGGPNCSGGGSAGVDLGDSTTGSLTLTFSGALSELTLSDFVIRYQSISGAGAPGSAIGRGTTTSTGGTSSGGTPVPAPAVFALFALAAGGIAASRGKRRAAPVMAYA